MGHSLKWNWGRKEGYSHVTLVEEDDKPEEEKEVEQEDVSPHRACEDRDYKVKYMHVTLVGEDDKPEDGEEIELRRGESSPRTTRKRIVGKETKEGRVIEQGKDFEGSGKSSLRQEMDRKGSERLPAGWMESKERV